MINTWAVLRQNKIIILSFEVVCTNSLNLIMVIEKQTNKDKFFFKLCNHKRSFIQKVYIGTRVVATILVSLLFIYDPF